MRWLTPPRIVTLSFLVLILMGTLGLALPWSGSHGAISPLDALFTSTSAVCVTGLVVLDLGLPDLSGYDVTRVVREWS